MLLKNGVLRFVFFVLTLLNGVIHSYVNSEDFGVDQTEFDISLGLWLCKHACNHFVLFFYSDAHVFYIILVY
jgi:hypothetical protein